MPLEGGKLPAPDGTSSPAWVLSSPRSYSKREREAICLTIALSASRKERGRVDVGGVPGLDTTWEGLEVEGTETEKQRDSGAERQSEQRDRDIETARERETDRDRDRETGMERDTETLRQNAAYLQTDPDYPPCHLSFEPPSNNGL